MVGQSSTGKSHLLTQMIAEITDGGLEPFGLKWQSVNPEQHARFVRERVQPLRNGKVLDHTGALGLDGFARFVESSSSPTPTGRYVRSPSSTSAARTSYGPMPRCASCSGSTR